ncbi:hypothetical protein RP20_CCG001331 [Aedes albopictus]|nr:hypothetical protein RP20_CCG001331 [Aedes albopictus]
MTSWSLHVTYSPRGVVWPSSPFVQNIRNRTWTRNLKPFKSILAHALSTLGPYLCADLCRMTFIADERFQSFYVENSGVWTLQIKYVQARDAGIYECQVSTEPKISARVHLHVVVPRTELIGDSDRYVKAGSAVILRCVVRGALEPPSYIIWYHGTQQIFTENRRGWKTQLDRGAPDLDGDIHSTIGSLIIESTRKKDSGNYSCSPSNSPPITVSLHVINGESSASAVTSSAGSLFDGKYEFN